MLTAGFRKPWLEESRLPLCGQRNYRRKESGHSVPEVLREPEHRVRAAGQQDRAVMVLARADSALCTFPSCFCLCNFPLETKPCLVTSQSPETQMCAYKAFLPCHLGALLGKPTLYYSSSLWSSVPLGILSLSGARQATCATGLEGRCRLLRTECAPS